MTTSDIQALIEEANRQVGHIADKSKRERLIADLAAALSALSGEVEWEYGVGYEGNNGVEVKWFSLYDQAFTIREAAEHDLKLYTDDANVKLLRRRKAGEWEVAP